MSYYCIDLFPNFFFEYISFFSFIFLQRVRKVLITVSWTSICRHSLTFREFTVKLIDTFLRGTLEVKRTFY